MSTSIDIWTGMLRSGVDKKSVLLQVKQHLKALKTLKSSSEVEAAIREVSDFAKFLDCSEKLSRIYLASKGVYTSGANRAYDEALDYLNRHGSHLEEFAFPDYGGLPEQIFKELSTDHVDNIQHHWHLIRKGDFK